jgi:hypothetical protein
MTACGSAHGAVCVLADVQHCLTRGEFCNATKLGHLFRSDLRYALATVSRFRASPSAPTIFASALLVCVSLIFVPLLIACVGLELDSPITVEQRARVGRVNLILLSSCLLFQPIAASIIRPRLFPASTGWWKGFQFVGITTACAIASLGLGLPIFGVTEQHWMQLAWSLFG